MHVIDGYCTPGVERETRLSAGKLLQEMDGLRISQALIAPEDHELAVNNIEGNDRMLELAEAAEGRFIPACTVNPWFGQAGCRELRRAAENAHDGEEYADRLEIIARAEMPNSFNSLRSAEYMLA